MNACDGQARRVPWGHRRNQEGYGANLPKKMFRTYSHFVLCMVVSQIKYRIYSSISRTSKFDLIKRYKMF